MYSTTAYLYQQKTQVLLLDSSGQYFTMRYDPVYAKRLTLNLGVDNVLLFSFVNQDEKPVNVNGCTFTFRITNTAGTVLLLQSPMTILNAATGQVKVTILGEDTLELIAQPASYSISVQSGNLNQAVFTNAQAGARAPIDLVNSVFPQFVPSIPLTIPTTSLSSQTSFDGAGYEQYPGWAGNWYYGGNGSWYNNNYQNTEFYSSFIEPRNYVTTIQMDLIGYTGTIKAQFAQNYQSIFYNITESTTYYDETKTIYMNIIGWYPLLRLCFNNSLFSTPHPPGVPASAYAVCNDGVLTDMVIQNGGYGYLAPPKVDIVGNGSGAEVTANIDVNGTVTGFNIINGGSGYWPIPSGGVNQQNYPVPPAQQGAFPIISTGYITNILYR
jgi:hypothetical protein